MTKAEIETGVALLARGRKQDQLRLAANAVFTAFEGRCLAFDCAATPFYADIVMRSKPLGRPMSVEDAQIASVALVNALNLATRNRIRLRLSGRSDPDRPLARGLRGPLAPYPTRNAAG